MFRSALIITAATLLCAALLPAQTAPPNEPDAVRVTVAVNPDGSHTAYQFDQPRHQAIATTTGSDGKLLGKTRYQIDDAGRFASGIMFGPNGKFLFKASYRYDSAGRLEQEVHLDKADNVVNKIVYDYDAAGHRTGYSIFDASGKLIGRTSPVGPATPSAKKRKKER